MICAECKKNGDTSTVQIGSTISTAMLGQEFYDESGVYHHHDPNIVATEYWCSKGHNWVEKKTQRCHCGWPEGSGEVLATKPTYTIAQLREMFPHCPIEENVVSWRCEPLPEDFMPPVNVSAAEGF